jgi:hypothetical protein
VGLDREWHQPGVRQELLSKVKWEHQVKGVCDEFLIPENAGYSTHGDAYSKQESSFTAH